MDSSEIRVSDNLTESAVSEFIRIATQPRRPRGDREIDTVDTNGIFSVSLAGGSTPRGLYSRLADDPSLSNQLAWDRIHFFWGDERHVPPDHPDSNYRMAFEAMLSKAPVPAENIHRIHSELPDANDAAREYEDELRRFFKNEMPRFDLILLGMGPDGHTASLFPETEALNERSRWVVANRVEKFNTHRITLTPPVLNNAANVVFLVSGQEKSQTLKSVLEGPFQPDQFPSQLVKPVDGRLLWLVDRPAASLLNQS